MVIRVKSRMRVERIVALTDGVLAIVLTILVLSFEVPEHRFGHDALIDFFRKLALPFVAYLVSFGIVAAYWMQHAAIFHYVKLGNRTFFWINMLFLLPLTLLPFLTDLRATYPHAFITTLLYAGANTACGILLLMIWRHGIRENLLLEVAHEVDRSMSRRILLGIAINIVGACAVLISPHLSSAVFLLLPCIYLSHRTVDAHWMDAGAEDSPVSSDV